MAQTAFVLILTDDLEQGELLRDRLREGRGHSCAIVQSLDDARDSIAARPPSLVVGPVAMDGLDVARELGATLDERAPDATLALIGEAAPDGVELQNAELVVIPPETEAKKLAERLDKLARAAAARFDDRLLAENLEKRKGASFEGLVGDSPKMLRIFERIKKAARNKLTVLILGETGTGKDLIARAIHTRSDRATKPFLVVNCAAVHENLLESELFGHTKGAFTGAVGDRKGYFVAADGGTLFLDEIGDMPLPMQAKLLRVLENREVTPVGSTEVRHVDVRVISATNVNLFKRVEAKEFREDLYYRLKQWTIEVPALRERRQDIPILAQHMLENANAEHELSVAGFSSEALTQLTNYTWPGNVRELRNMIEALAWEVEDRRIEADDLPENVRGTRELVHVSGGGGLVGLTLEQVERMLIERTLAATDGNREQAAKMLNIGVRTLYRKIKEYEL